MIDARSGGTSGEVASSDLLGSSTTPLPISALGRLGVGARVELLLEWMMSVAGASVGAVLVVDESDRLAVQTSVGLDPVALGSAPQALTDLSFGLIVHAADLNGEEGADPESTSASSRASAADWPLDGHTRMVLSLPLDVEGQHRGAIRLGFSELRSLQPAEVGRLGLIADHVSSVVEIGRLARESQSRQSEVERVSAVLEEVERMKADFLSMISHELRTPLTAIIGYTDLLLRQVHGPLTDRQTHHQGAVKKAAHRLLALINDLLDVNRLESGNVVLNLEPVALLEEVHRAVAQVESVAAQRRVELRLDVPTAPVTITADPERLRQMLVNLLDNALKFTSAEGKVTVRVDHQNGCVSVAIVDTGVGVPAEQLDRIWDRFHQADSSSRRHFGGTGLGLAIVRYLTELHSGQVFAASDGPGHGSTFGFTVPLTDRAPEQTAGSPSAPPEQSPRAMQTRTVLIVDDEPDNREVISSIVQDVMGHVAVTAANGAEALAAAERRPDLVLLDLRMPGMNGFEVARALKRNPTTAPIPIVAITALDDENDRHEARQAGCVGCVTKPFTEKALTSAVSTVLALARPGADR